MRDEGKKWWFIGVYECDRAFGGHEEGGWYYDVGTLATEVQPAIVQEHEVEGTVAMMEAAIKELELNEGRYETGSVLCNGYYEVHRFEGECPDHFPKERPHYE